MGGALIGGGRGGRGIWWRRHAGSLLRASDRQRDRGPQCANACGKKRGFRTSLLWPRRRGGRFHTFVNGFDEHRRRPGPVLAP
jgi:hypothetical protein